MVQDSNLHCMQVQLDDLSVRSAAAHMEYQAALQEMQHSMQSAQDQAADADACWRHKAEELDLKIQHLQVHISLLALRCISYI